MKNILMIYPKIPSSTYWSFKYTLPFINKKAAFPPLGLMTVGAMIPDKYNVKLIDMNVEKLENSDIEKADLVFISAMLIQQQSFKKIVQICKKLGKTIVAGGPYPTSSYKKIKDIDHFILNEAEITLPQFFNDLENGNPGHLYTTDIKPDLTKTPGPRYDLINVQAYSNMAVQFSRGCPFNCEFCDIIELYGRKPRTKATDQFIQEIDAVYESGFRGSLFIVDDNFIGNKKAVKKLLPEIIKWQKKHSYPFTLFTEASINLGNDDELLSMMQIAAFDMVFIGIESPDPVTLNKTQKQQNANIDMLKIINKIQNKGIEVTGGFIVGFDTDTESIFDMQIDFINKAGIPLAMIGLLDALPGTQLYKRLIREKRLLKSSNGNNTHDLQLNFIPKMDMEKLVTGYKKILKSIYSPQSYFTRSLKLIKTYPKQTFNNTKVTFNDLRAVLLSLSKQTFSNYGFTYLKFLLKVLFYNYRYFPLAIRMAVKGYHFFNITNDILKADKFAAAIDKSLESFKEEVARTIAVKKITRVEQLIYMQLKLKKAISKKYHKLGKDIQFTLNDKITAFENYCNSLVKYWTEIIEKNITLTENQLFPNQLDQLLKGC